VCNGSRGRTRSAAERVFYQALLRAGAAGALRFAMKAARRAPRAHGMTVSLSAAALVMDLMKRALVFIISILNRRFSMRVLAVAALA